MCRKSLPFLGSFSFGPGLAGAGGPWGTPRSAARVVSAPHGPKPTLVRCAVQQFCTGAARGWGWDGDATSAAPSLPPRPSPNPVNSAFVWCSQGAPGAASPREPRPELQQGSAFNRHASRAGGLAPLRRPAGGMHLPGSGGGVVPLFRPMGEMRCRGPRNPSRFPAFGGICYRGPWGLSRCSALRAECVISG